MNMHLIPPITLPRLAVFDMRCTSVLSHTPQIERVQIAGHVLQMCPFYVVESMLYLFCATHLCDS